MARTVTAALKLRRPRWISILVDGNEEDQSAAHAIAQRLKVTYCKQYDGYDRNLPRLLAITTL